MKDITLDDISFWLRKKIKLLVKYRLLIIFVALFGGASGYLFAKFKPLIYTAKITFVVEESKSNSLSSLGGLASIAGQFGVDMGNAGGGLFSGDNIILYFRSSALAKEVLMLSSDSNSDKTLADLYAEVYDYKNEWESELNLRGINFSDLKSNKKSRILDSLLNYIVNDINIKRFQVSRIDKKAGFIEVKTEMKNEYLAKKFAESIVDLAVKKFVAIKIQRQKNTVEKLQNRADSISNLLSIKTVKGASLQTNNVVMDINPLYRTQNSVNMETTMRDKTMLATIFASVIQNLELAKFTLSQETPVIQIIDTADIPLSVQKPNKYIFILSFSILLVFITTIIIVFKFK